MAACAVALLTWKRRIHTGARGIVQGKKTIKQAGICVRQKICRMKAQLNSQQFKRKMQHEHEAAQKRHERK